MPVALEHRAADAERHALADARCGLLLRDRPRVLRRDEAEPLAVLLERVVEHLLEHLLRVAVGDLVGELALQRVELRLQFAIEPDAPLPAALRDRLD
ncbi:MAG: hypothetical protein U0229_21155, partial [Anaeromyxobacter sp.]